MCVEVCTCRWCRTCRCTGSGVAGSMLLVLGEVLPIGEGFCDCGSDSNGKEKEVGGLEKKRIFWNPWRVLVTDLHGGRGWWFQRCQKKRGGYSEA